MDSEYNRIWREYQQKLNTLLFQMFYALDKYNTATFDARIISRTEELENSLRRKKAKIKSLRKHINTFNKSRGAL